MEVIANQAEQGRGNIYQTVGDFTILHCPDKDGTYHRVIIDTADLPKVISRNWRVANFYPKSTNRQTRLYAYTCEPHPNKRTVYLHRFVTDCPTGFEVDHRNHDSLDNRRSMNLRVVTHAENMANKSRYVWVKHVPQPKRPCHQCGADFQPAKKHTKYCSRRCAWDGRKKAQ